MHSLFDQVVSGESVEFMGPWSREVKGYHEFIPLGRLLLL